jgi:hypothetical protein
MPTPTQSANEILSLFLASGARTGRTFDVCVGNVVTELHTVATDGTVAVKSASVFTWDGGVSYQGGSALTPVSGAPTQGQYSVSGGVYKFNAADVLAKVSLSYRFASVTQVGFPGALQKAFLNAGYAIGDLVAGLAYAIAQGWLSTTSPPAGDFQTYVLEQSGFAQAGGTAPTPAASAQQIVNVFAANNNRPNGALFKARDWLNAFVGTVGGNTFAPEDLMPGAWYAVAQGWLRPGSWDPFEAAFILTAAGAAQAT